MATYSIQYSHKKPGSNTSYGSSATVQAETEATAIRIVEGKHPGEEITIKSIKKKD